MTKLKKFAISAATLAVAAAPVAVFAQELDLGLNSAESIGLGTKDIRETVGSVIKAFMGLLGIVAVCIILLGGFKWMTAMGSEEKVSQAKNLIISGIIGLVIILSAYAIAAFVINAILNGTR